MHMQNALSIEKLTDRKPDRSDVALAIRLGDALLASEKRTIPVELD